MNTFLLIILAVVATIAYGIVGFVLGATLFKRRNASWRWVNSNLGEFIMSLSFWQLVRYAIFWPLLLSLGLLVELIYKFERWSETLGKPKPPKQPPESLQATFIDDIEFNSMYPTVVKVYPENKSNLIISKERYQPDSSVYHSVDKG